MPKVKSLIRQTFYGLKRKTPLAKDKNLDKVDFSIRLNYLTWVTVTQKKEIFI